LRRLSSVPGIAQLFTSADAGGGSMSMRLAPFSGGGAWARLRVAAAAPLDRGSGDKVPAGYEDALKVYFETLAQTSSSRPSTATEGP
jgi:hypothetical protein